jgi:hypothetical protein
MQPYHDGLLDKRAPRPTRHAKPEENPTPRKVGPAMRAAILRIRAGEPRELVLREEFRRHDLPWAD